MRSAAWACSKTGPSWCGTKPSWPSGLPRICCGPILTKRRLDASGCAVLPGFVDPHTHVIWAGDRAAEFEMKMAGAKYMEILAAGGGILSTVRQTRAASLETLMDETRPRLQRMFSHGTTTAEAKTGYGLQTETELRMLDSILETE